MKAYTTLIISRRCARFTLRITLGGLHAEKYRRAISNRETDLKRRAKKATLSSALGLRIGEEHHTTQKLTVQTSAAKLMCDKNKMEHLASAS